MQARSYHRVNKNTDGSFSFSVINIDSFDVFEEPLEIIVTDINNLTEIGDILNHLNFVPDNDYFYHQCRDVISVPEKHINHKGEGKFCFQAYFHNFPNSVLSINKNALVVIVLHPQGVNELGQREFNVVSYIHVNPIDVNHEEERYDGYYYNMLRVSERVENNVKIYRRKKIFTLMFSVMHSIVGVEENTAFTYGAMGKENQAIDEALQLNTKLYDKHYEKWAFSNNTKINKFFGSKRAFKKCIDITDNEELLRVYYKKLQADRNSYTFYHIPSEEDFLDTIRRIISYSATSRIYMVPDENGEMDAVCFAINWGDYFAFQLEDPRGLFRYLAKMKLTDNILYPVMIVGSPARVKTLLKGVASHYNKTHQCRVTTLNSFEGDPYYPIKKSMIRDEYLFLIITNDANKLEAMKEHSKGEDGHVKLFIDVPLL